MKKTVMIKKNYEFRNFFNKGNYFSGNYIEIFYHKNNKEYNRLGIVVSKKVGKSVIRNKIKRLIRESYSNLEKDINGFNLIISWKKNISSDNANYYNVLNDLSNILKKVKIIY